MRLHYNGANSYLFVNGTKITKFKAKDFEITAYPFCLGNISKDWSVEDTIKTGLKGYVYDFSVDYEAFAISDIVDIHKNLMKKMTSYKMFGLIKKVFFIGLAFVSL